MTTARERAEAILLEHQQGITISGSTVDAMLAFAAEQFSAGQAAAEEACCKVLEAETMSKHVSQVTCASARYGITKCIDAIAALPTSAPPVCHTECVR